MVSSFRSMARLFVPTASLGKFRLASSLKGYQFFINAITPACVRPDHLFLGTQADNIHDMDAKGRRAKHNPLDQRGTKNHQAKLTEATVRKIKSMDAQGASQAEIMRATGVNRKCVWSIVRGLTWQHVTLDGRDIRDVLADPPEERT